MILAMAATSFFACSAAQDMEATQVQDKQAILQALIDSNRLEKYFHADTLKERVPLRMVRGSWYEEGIQLMKFGQPVLFVSSQEVSEPHLIVPVLEIAGNEATLSFQYPPEGIAGEAMMEKEPMDWTIKSFKLVEQ
ncbi:hypothetical protein [Thiocystis violacea]|uniref:hypothetical protein n=1 Tax=Thiocystis violacea TaxID=13725 RepID=UPI001906C4DE|nr:hypothetical protein [Thiocystis violacea]